MRAQILDKVSGELGYIDSFPENFEGNAMTYGSRNLLISGDGKLRSFKGLAALSGNGSSVMFSFGAGTAGLAKSGGIDGKGSVYAGPSLACIYIGTGDVLVDRVSLSTAASTTLALRLLRSGSYTGSALNGPFTAGLAAPLAGTLAAGAAGLITGAVSFKHTWVRNATGAEGNASPASNTITFSATKANYLISETAPNGADRIRLYPTPRGFGSTGPNYFYVEKTVASFRRTVTDVVTNSTITITSATAAFTAADVGASVVLSGGGSLSTTIATFTNATTVDLAAAPGWSTSGNTGVISDLIIVDFSDADLQARLAPIDYNVPPVGVWAFQLESVWAVVGCYGDTVLGPTVSAPGNSIAVSRVNRYEAFPADFLLGLPAAPTGIAQRASEAFTYVWGTSYVGACTFTGGSPPISLQILWANTGFANQHSACIASGGQLYGFSSQRGMIRIGADGEPDIEFGVRVQKIVEGWTAANVVVGWDSDHTSVIYLHGSVLLAFNTTTEKWSAPVDVSASPMSISGSAVSAATNGSSLAFSLNNAGTFTAYPFNTGTSGSIWEWYSTWRTGGMPEILKTIGPLRGTFKHNDATTNKVVTTKIYKQDANGVYQTSAAAKTISTTIAAVGTQHFISKCNVRNAKAVLFYQTGRSLASGDAESAPVNLVLEGTHNFVRK